MNERLTQIAFGIVGALDDNNVEKFLYKLSSAALLQYSVSIAWLLKNVEKKTWEYLTFVYSSIIPLTLTEIYASNKIILPFPTTGLSNSRKKYHC
jgi:hypothetical protein